MDVKVTYTDELEQSHIAMAHCKNIEWAKRLTNMVRHAINQGYGFAKCRALLEGDSIQ